MKSRDYAATISVITKYGYAVEFIPIKWSRTTINDWVHELDNVYNQYDPKQTILAGFSFGAMTVFMSATRRNPSELWLFSLSPYFSEDLASKNMKKAWLKRIGQRRVAAFNQLNFDKLARFIDCKTLLFAGQLEIDKWPVIGERAISSHKLLKNNKLTIIENSGHDVTNRQYIAAIETLV